MTAHDALDCSAPVHCARNDTLEHCEEHWDAPYGTSAHKDPACPGPLDVTELGLILLANR